MKKVVIALLAMCMMILPIFANAAELEKVNLEDYNTMNLIKTLESEEIEVKLKDYKETDDQVTIYLFRGTGCAYCRAFLTFLNGLEPEYAKKIKVVSFDAWYDEDAANLLTEVSSFLEEDAGGVPYVIIGKTVFPGYATDYDEAIKAAIDDEYSKKDKYDVFEEYNKHIDELIRKERQEKLMPVLLNGVVTGVFAVIIIFYISYSNSKLLYALRGETTYHNLETDRVEEVEPIVVDNKKKINHTQNKKNNNNKKTNKKVNK